MDERDGNDQQRERAEGRMRKIVRDDVTEALEGVGIDIKTIEGRRTMRARLDYLDRLYSMQDANRERLDFAGELLAMQHTLRNVLQWATMRMEIEKTTGATLRKTLTEKAASAAIWILGLGVLAALGVLTFKGKFP